MCPSCPEEGVSSPRTEVVVSCELSDMDAGTQTQIQEQYVLLTAKPSIQTLALLRKKKELSGRMDLVCCRHDLYGPSTLGLCGRQCRKTGQ